MTDNSRMATASDKLALLTDKYIACQKLSHNWLVILRACQRQMADLNEHGRLNEDIENELADMMTVCTAERKRTDNYLAHLDEQMAALNEQIQNGVYNDVQTA